MADILGTDVDATAAADAYEASYISMVESGVSISRARVLARMELLQATEADPFVNWLARVPLLQFPDYALTCMRSLPCTLDDLDAVAVALLWCPTWNNYVAQARIDGVL